MLPITLLSAVLLAAPPIGLSPIEPGQFETLRALIVPGAEESAWTAIAWQTDLWQARRLAAAEGKPILLWEMDGHPLGCT
jgi:hypothetical protein